ncbi:MAG: archaemetzincin family Zn-dependent metalloprotease [Bacteroidales bacterium]|nr:archaemetzincin family Zn-dependent metalloprotease [Bacteroidales bacterium]MCF8390070.1 archaemetzincin family Zn-dependent metalloprotease [Bacteroidales bacterium]
MDIIMADIRKEFQFPVLFKECSIDLSNFYDPGRRQYNANELLGKVAELSSPNALKTIGLFKVDLFIPILTYIFGQAFLNGNTGIVSLYRLRNEHYGLEKDEKLQLERFKKVIIHELGHSFGLTHCHNPVCIMRSSTYVEDIDQKDHHFCHTCKSLLDEKRRELIGSNKHKRL